MLRIRLYCLMILGFSMHVAKGQQYEFQNYSVSEGLAQSQVFAMIEDRRGFLWLGTQGGGLSKFDGIKFQNFTIQDGLPNPYVRCLMEASTGDIWIGTERGISRYDGQRFASIAIPDSIPATFHAFGEDHTGRIWVAGQEGVGYLLGDSLILAYRTHPALAVRAETFLPLDAHTLLIGHQKGWLAWSTQHDSATALPSRGFRNKHVTTLKAAPDSTVWIGTYGAGVFRWDGQKLDRPIPQPQLDRSLIFDLMFDDAGNCWLATQDVGAYQWSPRDSSLISLDQSAGLPSNHVHRLLEDQVGNIWMGTSGGGLSKYAGQQFQHWGRSQGISGGYAYAVTEDAECTYWIGLARGIARFDGAAFMDIDLPESLARTKVKALFADREDRLWVGTEGAGLWMKSDTLWRQFLISDGLSGNWIRDMIQRPNGEIWVATAGGGITQMIPRVDSTGLNWTTKWHRLNNGLLYDRINDLHQDQLGRIWYATHGRGIGCVIPLANGAVEHRHVPIDQIRGARDVRALAESPRGQLWMGIGANGVAHLNLYDDPSDWKVQLNERPLTSLNVYLMEFDERGELWIGSEQGVDRATLDELGQIIEVNHYNQSDGFVGIETCRKASLLDRNGDLWFGTIQGLTKYQAQAATKDPHAPLLSMTGISLFYEPLAQTNYGRWVLPWNRLAPGLELPHDQNHLSFDFIGVHHGQPEEVKYQWQLVGSEPDWSPPTDRRSATYSNLGPGTYTFQVRSSNADGVWNDMPITAEFVIRNPYWQTWWFWTLCALAVGLLVWAFVQFRLNQVREKARTAQERLEMEKGLIEWEQKALRLQMNPHFIFHALNSIQYLITMQDTKSARSYLAKFSRLMRLVLENSREPLIPLESELQTLELYLTLERFSRGESFTYEIDVEDELDPEEVQIPPMIIQPFVENAIIHGIANATWEGKILVQFTSKDGQLQCTVTDNGIGRKAAKLLKSQQDQQRKSTALIVTQERLDQIQPDPNGQRLVIEDLQNDQGNPQGTKVTIRVPLVYLEQELPMISPSDSSRLESRNQPRNSPIS
ncbi:two-component regulator propeller domain-containing protein [Pontibacter sp. G13]|uniref:two-component regulator propeller domain-containing protein n=1 Tax=Pontibacter sp. G13 TaxID=3074898 RepID=UPI00288A2965|nr:two-component regulator propeller domain-containing protein [Pontibacter sp. G13]WNJ19839.1 two-component regulator propeller domain-containing protein [Pontibacter sp. G13]